MRLPPWNDADFWGNVLAITLVGLVKALRWLMAL